MASVKTAISLEESLFDQVEALAREMKTSRSRVFALAVEEFLRRRRNRELLERLNAAYEDGLDPAEEALLRGMRRHQRRLVEGEW